MEMARSPSYKIIFLTNNVQNKSKNKLKIIMNFTPWIFLLFFQSKIWPDLTRFMQYI